jgi:hypothetical protein
VACFMHDFRFVGRDEERIATMHWDQPKRDKSDFFEDSSQEDREPERSDFLDRKKEKAKSAKPGPQWEVEDSPPSDFVKDFFKPA